MPRVRLISTALALLVAGAATTTTAQAPASIAADPPWHANSIGTTSVTARDEFYQGLRDLDAERFIAARNHFNSAVAADPNFALGQLYAALNGASLADYKTHLDAAARAIDGATPVEQLFVRAERKNADNDVAGQIDIAQELVQSAPDNPRLYLYGGFSYESFFASDFTSFVRGPAPLEFGSARHLVIVTARRSYITLYARILLRCLKGFRSWRAWTAAKCWAGWSGSIR